MAYGILVPLPGIEPVSLQWKQKSQSPDHLGSPRTLLFLLMWFNVLLIKSLTRKKKSQEESNDFATFPSFTAFASKT